MVRGTLSAAALAMCWLLVAQDYCGAQQNADALAKASQNPVADMTSFPLQFNFMTPGARSLGMGGAFLGAADDATTASANPSGLASLSLREVSVEARYQRIETPYLFGGRISGALSGLGLDTVAGPAYGTDVEDQGALAFLSLVVPLSHFTIAAYRHEVAKMENTPTITSAAAVTTPAVDLMPWAIAESVDSPRSTASLIRLRMNTW